MRKIVVAPPTPDSGMVREPVQVEMDGVVLTAICPKDAVLARASGVFNDKYAPDSVLARTAFDFLETALDAPSWVYVVNRMNDRDDPFDTEHILGIFEGIFEDFTAQVKADEQQPVNREARRRVKT